MWCHELCTREGIALPRIYGLPKIQAGCHKVAALLVRVSPAAAPYGISPCEGQWAVDGVYGGSRWGSMRAAVPCLWTGELGVARSLRPALLLTLAALRASQSSPRRRRSRLSLGTDMQCSDRTWTNRASVLRGELVLEVRAFSWTFRM